jgi:hypothetical protein
LLCVAVKINHVVQKGAVDVNQLKDVAVVVKKLANVPVVDLDAAAKARGVDVVVNNAVVIMPANFLNWPIVLGWKC